MNNLAHMRNSPGLEGRSNWMSGKFMAKICAQ